MLNNNYSLYKGKKPKQSSSLEMSSNSDWYRKYLLRAVTKLEGARFTEIKPMN